MNKSEEERKNITTNQHELLLQGLSLFVNEIRYTLCSELSWSHIRLIMRLDSEKARKYYLIMYVKMFDNLKHIIFL